MKTMLKQGQYLYDFLYKTYGSDNDTIERAFLNANPHVYFLRAAEDTIVHPISVTSNQEKQDVQLNWN